MPKAAATVHARKIAATTTVRSPDRSASFRASSRIGGPDVLRYGQMMNGYAVEAGLPQRAIAPLPVLTPGLASHWVNLVTPVPRSIARPLIASLVHDCVMDDHDIDDLILPPEDGLTPYRRAVALALGRVEADTVETSWQDAEVTGLPSDPLPSDPEWAGRTVYTDHQSMHTTASPERLWAVIAGIGGENGWYSAPLLWAVRGWMDRLVGGVGLAGRLYWLAVLPFHGFIFRGMAERITATAEADEAEAGEAGS